MRSISAGGLAAAVTLLLGASTAAAPPDEPMERFRQVVGEKIVAIEISARPDEDEAQLLQVSGLSVGQPYRVSDIQRALKLLFSLGRFETVRVSAFQMPGGIGLILSLPPEPRLTEVIVMDGEALDALQVQEELRLQIGGPIHPRDLGRMRRDLERRLVELGYRNPAVGLAVGVTGPSGARALLVRINEGPRTRLRRVVVGGNPRLPLWQVARGVGIRSGDALDLTEVRPALEELRGQYLALGYLDAKIAPPIVREVAGEGDAPLGDLVIDIDAGPAVRVRFKGNRTVPGRDLRQDIAPLVELGTGPSALAEVRERILSRYLKRGYWQAEVEVAGRVTVPARDQREVLFSIKEGTPARVAEVRFPGNHALDERDLLAEIHAVVARALASDLDRPGADPEVVGMLLGDRSLVDRPRDSPQPDNTAPDPKQVYLPTAYRTAAEGLQDMYRAQGYQTVEVTPPEVRVRDDDGSLEVSIRVQEGLQWRVGALSFSGNEALSASELLRLSQLEPASAGGVALSFDRVEEARRAITERYKELGYLYVRLYEELRQVPPRGSLGWDYVRTSTVSPLDVRRVCARAAEARAPACDIELVFRLEEGPQVQAGNVIVRGVEKTRRRVIQNEVEVESGEILRASELIGTRDNLLRIGVFERVDVRPVDEDRISTTKDVLVEVKERDPYSLDLGAGFSTAEGVRGVAAFGDRNLMGTALRLQVQAKVNLFFDPLLVLYDPEVRAAIEEFYDGFSTFQRLEYELAAGLSYPRFFGLPQGFSAGFDMIVLRDYDPAFAEDNQRVSLVGNYKGFRPRLFGKPRQVNLQLRTAFDRTSLQCNTRISGRFALCSTTEEDSVGTGGVARLEGTNVYLTAGPQVSLDLRDDALDPSAGVYAELNTDAAWGLDAGSPNFLSVEGRINGYIPMASRLTLAVALVFGRIFPLQSLEEGEREIPINRRYFAGGRSTVRGYAERTLIPQDVQLGENGALPAISTGGNSRLAFKSEVRITVYGPFAVALFYDIGDLWEGGQFAFSSTQTYTDADGATVTLRRTLAHGGGVGLRVATPIGPISLDFAVPFNKRDPSVNDTQLHFSVGAF